MAYWPDENKSPNTIDLIKSREVDLVVNIPKTSAIKNLITTILSEEAPLIIMFLLLPMHVWQVKVMMKVALVNLKDSE